MRRLMLSLCALSLLGAMVGCKGTHTRGACDCQDEDQCYTRQPWVSSSPPGGIYPPPPSGGPGGVPGHPAPMPPPLDTSNNIRTIPHGN
jgi:hypothetical protein